MDITEVFETHNDPAIPAYNIIQEEPKNQIEERPWVKFFTSSVSDYEGYVNDLKTLSELLLAFEVATTSQFFMPQGPTCNYGKDFAPKPTTKIRFIDLNGSIPYLKFDGVPFVLMGLNVKKCLHGPQKHVKSNSPKKKAECSGFEQVKKRKQISSVKVDCTAEIRIRHIVKLLDFKLLEESKYKRNALSEKIHDSFKMGTELKIEHRFLILLAMEHCNHPSGEDAGAAMSLDSELSDYIHFNVRENPTFGPKEMQQQLEHYLRIVMFKDSKTLPPQSNARFWPSLKTIRNHILFSKSRLRENSLDQQNLYTLVSLWREENPHDNFYLRLKSTNENPTPPEVFHSPMHRSNVDFNHLINSANTELPQVIKPPSTTMRDKFLFVYQSSWQQELLSKYGTELCILEATYRVTKYSLPLFFVVVHTNINFIIVAMFIVEWESPILISEALKIIKDWNTSWWPKNFLTNFNDEEIKSVKLTFEDYKPNIFLCDTHRLQCWKQWFNTSICSLMKHDKDNILNLIMSVAESYTNEEYEYTMEILRNSDAWKADKNLQDWFYKKWLKIRERWVKLFRKDMLLTVHSTGGEWQTEKWKESNLRDVSSDKDRSLSQMVLNLIKKYLPNSFQSYCHENISLSESIPDYYDDELELPNFLHNRPHLFMHHEMKRWRRALMLRNTVYQMAHGVFGVSSGTDYSKKYRVELISENGLCFCECVDWRTHHLPCKHILAIVASEHYPTWTYECLPQAFTSGPFYTLDLLSIGEMRDLSNSSGCTISTFDQFENTSIEVIPNSINIIESEIMEGPEAEEPSCSPSKVFVLENIKRTFKMLANNASLLDGDIEDLKKLSNQAITLLESTSKFLPKDSHLRKDISPKKRKTRGGQRGSSKRKQDFTRLIIPNEALK